jgi:Protein of unknown function (DUF3343)
MNSATYFCLFHGIHEVLKVESALKREGASFELVPVPRALSSDCGVCIALRSPSDKIVSLLFSFNVDRCFSYDGEEYSQVDLTP